MKNFAYLLTILLIAAATYSLLMKRENTQLQQAIHGNYMNDLSNATQSLDLLQSEVTQSLLFQDERAVHESLDNVWRISSDLQATLAKLPLHQNVASTWNGYIGKVGDTAKLAATSKDESWRKQFSSVQTNLQQMSEQWSLATAALYQHDGNYDKWSQMALDETPNAQLLNAVGDLKTYHETDFPLTASESDYEKKRDLQHLMDKELTKDQAVERFTELFPQFKNASLTVTKSSHEAPYPFYHLQFVRGTKIGYADLTVRGGHLLSLLIERPFKQEALPHEKIRTNAEQFLKDAQIHDVAYVESRENETVWHLVFARTVGEDKALVYPDSIQLKVAKDTGEVMGMNAMEYIQKEKIPEMTSKPLDPQRFFAKQGVVEEQKLIYTGNANKELVLCYEFIVRHQNQQAATYRIVVDAMSHDVLKVELLN